jgi:mono/diheme cytochrome c family protein
VLLAGIAALADEPPLYTVAPDNRVDNNTLDGWKTWRALACDRCHGAEQQGLVGPSLIERLKVISKEDFQRQVMKGNPEKGMPPFESVPRIQRSWENLYAYLKGRSDGRIAPGHVYSMDAPAAAASK